ncbi:MAG: hypothetical protein ABH837_00900 [bacterium]
MGSPIILGAILVSAVIIGRNIKKRGLLKAQKLILPILLIISVLFLLRVEPTVLINQIIAFISVLIIYFFLVLYKKIPLSEDINSKDDLIIKNYFQFAIIFIAFLGFLSGYLLFYIYQYPLPIVTLFMIFISSILFYYLIWLFEGTLNSRKWLFVILLGLLISEFFFILAFWPVSPWIASTLLIVLFYFYFGVFHLGMEGKLEIKKVWEYLLIVIVILFVIISIMRWNY